MAGFFSTPQLPAIPSPPPAPSLSDPRVEQAASDAVTKAAQRQGRASTYLTNPSAQRAPDANQQRYLGGM